MYIENLYVAAVCVPSPLVQESDVVPLKIPSYITCVLLSVIVNKYSSPCSMLCIVCFVFVCSCQQSSLRICNCQFLIIIECRISRAIYTFIVVFNGIIQL